MLDNIVVVGGGGHAKVVISVLKKNEEYSILGYVDKVNRGDILGVRYLGNDAKLENIKLKCNNAVIAIGSVGDTSIRKRVYDKLKKLNFNFPIIISKDAIVNEDVNIEEGTVIMDGVVVQPGTKLGKCCIINTRSSIDHDCNIGDFAHIAPGVTLSGNVNVDDDSHLGTGSSVLQGIHIEKNCIIGVGTAVFKDCKASNTYIGKGKKVIK